MHPSFLTYRYPTSLGPRKLYEEKVGLQLKEEYARGAIYECGKGSWVLMYPSPGAGTSKAGTAFWAFDDVAAEVAELKAGGWYSRSTTCQGSRR